MLFPKIKGGEGGGIDGGESQFFEFSGICHILSVRELFEFLQFFFGFCTCFTNILDSADFTQKPDFVDFGDLHRGIGQKRC